MKLKHIELAGFKSFAKRERLDFEKRLTAIVGPNGSGKSNIAEAFRFVLGEQSMKSMRGKKTEDLLFNGSAMLPRTNRASVTLTLDNSDRTIKEAFDEVEIERVIHRDSTNEYYINGSPVRLKDIVELLSFAKIGTAGHHIISQGEADRLLSMTPRERKAHIEEALGLTQYKLKKIEAEKKLEKTNQNLESIRSLRRENAPHLEYLEREMQLIKKRKEVIEELNIKGRKYAEMFLSLHSSEKSRNQKEQQYLTEKLKVLEARVESSQSLTYDDAEDDTIKKLRNEIHNIELELKQLRSEMGSLAHSVGRLEAELEFRNETKEPSSYKIDAASLEVRLHKIREVLLGAINEKDVQILQSAVKEALTLSDMSEPETELVEKEDLEAKEKVSRIENELRQLEIKSKEFSQKEEGLIESKQRLENDVYLRQKEKESERLEAEKSVYEKRSIESKLEILKKEGESLRLEEGRFYASLEEISLIANIHFSKDDLQPNDLLQVSRVEVKNIDREVERLKLKIEGMQVGDTRSVERAYREAKERAEFLDREIADLEKTIQKLGEIGDELGEKIENEFSLGLKKISSFFETYFAHMFKGGSASLSLVQIIHKNNEEGSEKEFGVEVKVSMPHKLLKSTAMLSGGEKTLVSIALIFALSQVNPPPFLILDETDAALDEANSRRYGEALGELSKYSQLILITHNRETMSHAGMLYGITMGRSATSELLSIDLEEAEKIAR